MSPGLVQPSFGVSKKEIYWEYLLECTEVRGKRKQHETHDEHDLSCTAQSFAVRQNQRTANALSASL
jgi:hypothetical protein